MKVLLISPALTATERYGSDLGKVGPSTEPLGLAYLAAAVRDAGHSVRILDCEPLQYTASDVVRFMKKQKSLDVVGISFMTPMYLNAVDLIRKIRKTFPDIKIVVGGAHVTIMPAETMKETSEIDFAVVGEGEISFPALLDAVDKKKDLAGVKGVAYRKDGKVIFTAPQDFVKDIDTLPLPARELLPMEKYCPAPTYYKKLPAYIILTSRGCPYRCTYCSKISGRLYRHHSLKRVMEEIDILRTEYGAREIVIRDDTFTVDKNFVREVCNELIRRKLNKKISWTCMTRVLKLMKKAGCWGIHFGVESGVQRLLDLIQKDITVEQVRKVFKWTREVGIETKAFFMLGLPTETREDSMQTIEFARELDPDWVQFTITVPYPGTKLYDIAKTSGDLKSLNWEDYQTWAGWSDKDLVYVSEGRTSEELKYLQKYAMRSFYLRPKVMFRMIFKLRSFEIIPKFFFGGLALVKSAFRKKR
jgi:radical SAM superfamily enzyme YgiQ (UPF0313 family)